LGFRDDTTAWVWEIEPKSDRLVKARISINRKKKDSDEYEQVFGAYVAFVGTACAAKAAQLRPKDRIHLIRTDVEVKYTDGKNYTNFLVYDFDTPGDKSNSAPAKRRAQVSDNEPEPIESDDELPF
jgi:hypothetical protein